MGPEVASGPLIVVAPGPSLAPFIAKVFAAFEKVKALAALAFSEDSRRGELEMVVRHVR